MKDSLENSKIVGKYVIVSNLDFTDFMKDEEGDICVYDTLEEASLTCGMYEFADVLVMKIECNLKDPWAFENLEDMTK